MNQTTRVFLLSILFSFSSEAITLGERTALNAPLSSFSLSKVKKPTRSFANFDPNLVKKREKNHKRQIAQIKNMFTDIGIDIDTDDDGEADFFRTYEKGHITQVRSFSKNSKHPSYVATYKKGEVLFKEQFDYNSNGKFESQKKCNSRGACEYLSDTNYDGVFDKRHVEVIEPKTETVKRSIYSPSKKGWELVKAYRVLASSRQSHQGHSEGASSACEGDCYSQAPKADLSAFKDVADQFNEKYNRDWFKFGGEELYYMNPYGIVVNENCDEQYGRDTFSSIIEASLSSMMACSAEARELYPALGEGIRVKLEAGLLATINVSNPKQKLKVRCPAPGDGPPDTAGMAFYSSKHGNGSDYPGFTRIPRPIVGIFNQRSLNAKSMTSARQHTFTHELMHIILGQPHSDLLDGVYGCAGIVESCLSGADRQSEKYKSFIRLCGNPKGKLIESKMAYQLEDGHTLNGFEAVKQALLDTEAKRTDFAKFSSLQGLRNVMADFSQDQRAQLLEIVISDHLDSPKNGLRIREGALYYVPEKDRHKYAVNTIPKGLRKEILDYMATGKEYFADDLSRYLAFYLNQDKLKGSAALKSLAENMQPNRNRSLHFIYRPTSFEPFVSSAKQEQSISETN